jgi:hypothetical protein
MADERDWVMPSGPFAGGCQCGAIRFRAEALVDNPHICHCRMCQKATGNLFGALVGVQHEHMIWTRGTPSRFRSSEHVDRGFCANCGTPLFYHYLPGKHISMSIGAFDHSHSIELRWQMGNEGRHPSLNGLDWIEQMGTTEEADGADNVAAIRASSNQHPDHDTIEWTAKQSTV